MEFISNLNKSNASAFNINTTIEHKRTILSATQTNFTLHSREEFLKTVLRGNLLNQAE